jgi:hypothetical protein
MPLMLEMMGLSRPFLRPAKITKACIAASL